jgi:hypothetical protein
MELSLGLVICSWYLFGEIADLILLTIQILSVHFGSNDTHRPYFAHCRFPTRS